MELLLILVCLLKAGLLFIAIYEVLFSNGYLSATGRGESN